MKKYITIGIPRSLLYHTYGKLWIHFFDLLNIKYIVSPKTNKKILNRGLKLTNSEACLSLKLFIGHTDYLKNKCDVLFIPRIQKLKYNEVVCTNFNALYDITRNIFPDLKILHYNIDCKKHKNEYKEFIKIGRYFNKSVYDSTSAYFEAKRRIKDDLKNIEEKNQKLLKNNNDKILIVGQNYNLYDELIGNEVKKVLENNNISVIISTNKTNNLYKKIMPSMYFSYSKSTINSILSYKDKISGVIILTSFPCGSDSLVIDMIKRKIKDIPIISIVFDDFMSNTGLVTRIESFIDIIKEKK